MNITLSPQRADTPRTLSKAGDVLTVDGEAFDFAFISEGDVLPRAAVAGDWLASDVTRTAGVLQMTITLPHGANAPHATRFPAALNVTADGPITLPPYDEEEV